ncbi:MAG: metallophosphoesterase [Gemmatimonadaceae bacterium]
MFSAAQGWIAFAVLVVLSACITSRNNVAAATDMLPCDLALVRGMSSVPDSFLPRELITTMSATTPATNPNAPNARDTLDATIYLVGDAGYPVEAPASVLAHVHAQIAAQDAHTRARVHQRQSQQWVVYLGDNAYPRGLPAPDPDSAGHASPNTLQTERDRAVCALEQQVEAVPAPARVLFVPGNHDWRPAGCVKALNPRVISCIRSLRSKDPTAVKREGDFLNGLANGRVLYRPRGGCPGPDELRIGSRVVILPFDSEWILRHADNTPDPNCAGATPRTVIDSLSARMNRVPASDFVIVAAHHPMRSGGEHGNACGGPSGIAGAAFTEIRKAVEIGEDFSGEEYQLLRKELTKHLGAMHRPVAYISGHDHTLQVFADTTSGHQTHYITHYITSGAGSVGTQESSCIHWQPGMIYPFSAAHSARETPTGFMRVDVYHPAGVRLSVFTLNNSGAVSRTALFNLE